jgi:cytochrome P450
MAGWNKFTVVDRREAVVSALRDPLLSSNPGVDSPNLLFLDGADHRRLRALVRRILARLEPLPSSLVEEIRTLVGALAPRDGFDLVADFARPVAGVVAAAVLGVGSLDDRVLASLEEAEANLEIWSGVAGAGDRAALRVAMFFLKSDPIPGGGLAVLREARLAGEVSDDELTLTPVMLAHAAYANSLNFLALAGLRIASDPALARRARDAPDTAVTRALAAELSPARVRTPPRDGTHRNRRGRRGAG